MIKNTRSQPKAVNAYDAARSVEGTHIPQNFEVLCRSLAQRAIPAYLYAEVATTASLIQRLPNHIKQLFCIQRLAKKSDSPALEGLLAHLVVVVVSGHKNYGAACASGVKTVLELQATLARQLDVEDQAVGFFGNGSLQKGFGRHERFCGVTGRSAEPAQRTPYRGIVVYNGYPRALTHFMVAVGT